MNLEKYQVNKFPWHYVVVEGCLDGPTILDADSLEISTPPDFNGNRSYNNPYRVYVTKENVSRVANLANLIGYFQKSSTARRLEVLLQPSSTFQNCYVRCEIVRDPPGFWLKPHVDIKEKLMTCMIYINNNNEDWSIGTDLYNEYRYSGTVPFLHNTAVMFANSEEKIHGVSTNKKIINARKMIIVNYVTFETDWPVND